ncbi:MAG: signal recognition particle protein [Dehalococcoidia bacterium]
MFDNLTDRISNAFKKLSGHTVISEQDFDDVLKEIRRALLEADVNFRVVKNLQQGIRERVIGEKILDGVSPSQQIIKIFQDELTAVLGNNKKDLSKSNNKPATLLMIGLQGSGKTTTSAKISKRLVSDSNKVLMVAGDLKRPAAIEQITKLGERIGVETYSNAQASSPKELAKESLKLASNKDYDWLVFDSAGRIQIDNDLMDELENLHQTLSPSETLLVVDAMTGQEAVNVATEFQARVPITGIVITKMDSDARGGAALSIVAETGIPVIYIGTGEKLDDLDAFYPDRLAGRILGMGDVVSLVEKAQQTIDESQAIEMEKRLKNATFTLDDFLVQIDQLRNMGPMNQILEMIPGFKSMAGNISNDQMPGENDLKKVEAIVLSMTPLERRSPHIIGGSRRKRIAKGSGTQPADVNRLLNQFEQMKKMMKALSSGKKMPGMPF